MAKRFTIGLTGGIGSGKTMVSNRLGDLGAAIVDTDVIAHQLTGPDAEGSQALAAELGLEILEADGRLNRKKMREMAFRDPSIKQRLEAILHPLIRRDAARQLEQQQGQYVLLVVPLLAESPYFQSLCDRILAVDCPESLQIDRVIKRSHLSHEQVISIIKNQTSREIRKALADDIIDNSGTQEELEMAIQKLHQNYLCLAQLHKAPE